MEMTRFATQHACAFSFDHFATENKGNSAKHFSSYCKITNRPDIFMVCTLIDHRNDAIKSSNLGSWFHLSFEHLMASLLWSIRVQTMKKSGRFVKSTQEASSDEKEGRAYICMNTK